MFGKFFTKVSLFFFGGVTKFFAPKLKELTKNLSFTNLEEDIYTYFSNILFTSFLIWFFLIFLLIFLMLKLNILFNFFSFLLVIIISFTFSGSIFILLYNFPKYLLISNKRQIEEEIEKSIKHLSALNDPNLTVRDILFILQKINDNKILTQESKKILAIADLNKNLKETIKQICDSTYSEQEFQFFSKLIEVLDKKQTIDEFIKNYFISTEQNLKEKEEHKKNRITLLFQINIFLFFLIFILVFSLFLIPISKEVIKDILFIIAIAFPIVELILIIILSK